MYYLLLVCIFNVIRHIYIFICVGFCGQMMIILYEHPVLDGNRQAMATPAVQHVMSTELHIQKFVSISPTFRFSFQQTVDPGAMDGVG